MFRARIVFPFMLLSLASVAAAETPELVTDRPDATESSKVVPPGLVQLELGFTWSEEDELSFKTETQELLATLVRIGLVDRVELRVGWGGLISEDLEVSGMQTDEDGAGDAELGAKIYLREEQGRAPELALLFGASLPTGDSAFTSDRVDPAFRFSLSHGLSDRVDLGYNLGMAWGTETDGGGERDTLSHYVYTVSAGIGLTEKLGAFVEAFGEIPASAAGGPANSIDGGITYLVRDNLQLDAALGLGVSDAADDWFLGVGVSARFPR